MAAPSIKSGTGIEVIETCDSGGPGGTAGISPLSGSSVNAATQITAQYAGGIGGTGAGVISSNANIQGGAIQGTVYALSASENFSSSLLGVVMRTLEPAGLVDSASDEGAFILANSGSAGTEEAAWSMFGEENSKQDFRPFIVNPASDGDAYLHSGTFDETDITHVGIAGTFDASYRNIYFDTFVKLDDVVLIGGETGDRATMQDFLDHGDDNDFPYYEQPTPSFLYAFFTPVVGDGSTVTWFDDTEQTTIEFPSQPDYGVPDSRAHINDNDLGFEFNGHASGGGIYRQQNKTFRSGSPFRIKLEGDSTYSEPFINNIIGAGDVVIEDGWEDQSTWDGCGPLQCSQPTLNGSIIKNAPGVGLQLDSDNGLTNATAITVSGCTTGIEVDITGDPATCDIDITNHTFSGNTTDILYSGTGTLTIAGTTAQESALTTSAPSGTIVWDTPTDTLTINSNVAALIQIFTTNTQTVLSSATGTQDTYEHSGQTVDYVVQAAGYIPQRVTGLALSGSPTVTVNLVPDPVYNASHGLTFTTDYSYNATTRVMTIVAAQQGRDLYSAMIDDFISESALFNKPFPLQAIGIDRIDFTSDGTTAATIDSGDVQYWRGAGMEWEHATTGNPTHKFCSIKGTGTNAAGTKGYYQQVDGASPSALSLVSNNIDQVIQYYSDPNGDDNTADGYDYSGHLVVKLFNDGYYQKAANILTAYGASAIESFEYIIDMQMTETGLGTGDRSITITVTDNTPSGVEEQTGYTFDYKIEGGASDSPEDLLRQWIYDVYTDPTASDYASKVNFNWPDPILESGGSYETQRGYVYGQDTTTTYSGFYVEEGSDYHPDFLRQQSNDGTYFVTPIVATISVSGMSDDSTAGDTRLQLWNETGRTANAWAATTAQSLGSKRLRSTGVGTESVAGLYFVCTVAGTTGGTEPTWDTTPGNTTSDGTVTWTAYKVLYHDADPAGTSIADTYNDNEEFADGDTVGYRFADMDAANSHKIDSGTVVASSSGFTIVVSPTADSVYATNAVDGSAVTQFTADFADDEIDLSADADFTAAQAYAFFCYTLTTANGMWNFWGGVVATSGNYEVQTSTLNLYFDNTTTGSVKQTDSARIYRDDGTYPVKDPTTSGYGVQVNWANQVFSVNTGGSGLTAGESALLADISPIKAKTDSLSFTVANQVDANIQYVNDVAVTGDGQEGSEWGPA